MRVFSMIFAVFMMTCVYLAYIQFPAYTCQSIAQQGGFVYCYWPAMRSWKWVMMWLLAALGNLVSSLLTGQWETAKIKKSGI